MSRGKHSRTRRLKHPPTIDHLRTKYDAPSGSHVAEGEAVVHHTTPDDVAAYLMDLNSKDFQTKLNRDLYPCYEVREVVNGHHSIMFNEIRTSPFQNRTMVVSLLWKKVCNEPLTYVWCAVSIDGHASVRPEDEAHTLRADLSRCVRLTALSSHSTKLEMVTTLDLKGNFPKWFVDAVILPQVAEVATSTRRLGHVSRTELALAEIASYA